MEYVENRIPVTLYFLVICAVLTFGSGESVAAEEALLGISSTRVEKIQLINPKAAKDSCVAFEATFSDPLKTKPTATIDVEDLHRIEGVISRILKAIQISPKRYRFLMKADDTTCAAVRASREDIVVTVGEATAEDGREILPEQRTFRAKKNHLVPRP